MNAPAPSTINGGYGGGAPIDLTNFCINVKSNPKMHQNPPFSGKNSFFSEEGAQPPLQTPSTVCPIMKFWICHWVQLLSTIVVNNTVQNSSNNLPSSHSTIIPQTIIVYWEGWKAKDNWLGLTQVHPESGCYKASLYVLVHLVAKTYTFLPSFSIQIQNC